MDEAIVVLDACGASAELTLVLGVGATLELTLECQAERDHHAEHFSDLGSGFTELGVATLMRASWANHEHAACMVCHRQRKED